VFLIGHALGVHIYSRNATPNGFNWGFVAPRANPYTADYHFWKSTAG
jgi:hypothetical protein